MLATLMLNVTGVLIGANGLVAGVMNKVGGPVARAGWMIEWIPMRLRMLREMKRTTRKRGLDERDNCLTG